MYRVNSTHKELLGFALISLKPYSTSSYSKRFGLFTEEEENVE
uniref:Uncharacterized protein n=1 Tax=Ipomoea trifida TaxID=35884 RepID=A0A8X9_IPOTF|nr:hypothetical protein [Ipomoea trifida]